jgi:hypothetical protein
VAETLATVKTRLRRMRACNETATNGRLCLGHLKRWYGFGPEWRRVRPGGGVVSLRAVPDGLPAEPGGETAYRDTGVLGAGRFVDAPL